MRAVEYLGGSGATAPRVEALADAVSGLRDELMLIDPAILLADVLEQKFANLNDIVDSSVELFFEPRTITFGLGADARIGWREPPSIFLDLEFKAEGVTVFFCLVLGESAETVRIQRVMFDHPSSDVAFNTGRLLVALARARKPRFATRGERET